MESGKQVIITTLQKFPVILERVRIGDDDLAKAEAERDDRSSGMQILEKIFIGSFSFL